MKTPVLAPLFATLFLLLAACAAGQEVGTKEKPDPERYALRLEAALLIENPEQKTKALLGLAGDAAADGRGDLVKKCLAALPDASMSSDGIAAVLLKLAGSGREADALEAAKTLKDADVRDRVLGRMVEGLAIGPAALWKAAENGQDERVAKLLEAGVPKNAKDKEGETALMKAAARGHVAVVKLLLRPPRAELAEADNNGETALMKAVANGHQGVFDTVFNSVRQDGKAFVLDLFNAADRKGMTALMKAADRGDGRLVSQLLKIKYNEGFLGSVWVVSTTAKDQAGKTALEHAQENGHKQVVELLQASRGDPNKD
jgi:ankyrin repeat protein